MNRRDFERKVAEVMRDKNIKKSVSIPKQVFHISDDEGNTKSFTVKKSDKNITFSIEDVSSVLDACIQVIEDTISNGGNVTIQGFGSLGLRYMKPRKTKQVGTGKDIDIAGHYAPKFSYGIGLRRCADLYDLSIGDKKIVEAYLSESTPELGEEEEEEYAD